MANPVTLSLTLATPIGNGVALLQTLASAATVAINGTLASSSIATFDVARRLQVTSAGDDSAVNWIVVGTDRYGNPQTETFAGGISTASQSLYDYKTITALRSSGATAAGITAGTSGTGSTPWFCREFNSLGTLGVAIAFATSNPATGTFEITWDDPNAIQNLSLIPYGASVNPQSNVPPVPWPADGLTTVNQNTRGEVHIPCMAWRWTNNSGTTASIVQVIETVPYGQQNAF